MKYKRLTDRETAEMLKNTEGESWDSDLAEAQRYIRLAELEDKIENGTMIELPCKVGDTVYCIMAFQKMGTIYTTGRIVPRIVDKIIFDGKSFEIKSNRKCDGNNESNCLYYGFLGDLVFSSKEEAETRLAEIQNNS